MTHLDGDTHHGVHFVRTLHDGVEVLREFGDRTELHDLRYAPRKVHQRVRDVAAVDGHVTSMKPAHQETPAELYFIM